MVFAQMGLGFKTRFFDAAEVGWGTQSVDGSVLEIKTVEPISDMMSKILIVLMVFESCIA